MELSSNKINQIEKRRAGNVHIVDKLRAAAAAAAADNDRAFYYSTRAAALAECCNVWSWDAYHEAKTLDLTSVSRCKSRWCSNCSAVTAANLYRRLSPVAAAMPAAHITITAPNIDLPELPAALDALKRIFAQLWADTGTSKSKRARLDGAPAFTLTGALRSLEITYNPQADTFHPHIHALVTLPRPLPAWQLARTVPTGIYDYARGGFVTLAPLERELGHYVARVASGLPALRASAARVAGLPLYFCRVAAVEDNRGLAECLKYPLKPAELRSISQGDFVQLYNQLIGVHMRQTYGILRGLDIDAEELDPCEDYTPLLGLTPEEVITTLGDLRPGGKYASWAKISRWKLPEELPAEKARAAASAAAEAYKTRVGEGRIPKAGTPVIPRVDVRVTVRGG